MSHGLISIAVRTELERAKTAWDNANPTNPLLIDYENGEGIDLASVTTAYLMVDVVGRGGDQLDLGANPSQRMDGQIMLAAGAKEGTGTMAQSAILDFVYPYLQRRDNLLNGVRTEVAHLAPPKYGQGFYYLNMMIYFWRDSSVPAAP